MYMACGAYPLLFEHTLPSDPAGDGVGLTLFPAAALAALALGETWLLWLPDDACWMYFPISS